MLEGVLEGVHEAVELRVSLTCRRELVDEVTGAGERQSVGAPPRLHRLTHSEVDVGWKRGAPKLRVGGVLCPRSSHGHSSGDGGCCGGRVVRRHSEGFISVRVGTGDDEW